MFGIQAGVKRGSANTKSRVWEPRQDAKSKGQNFLLFTFYIFVVSAGSLCAAGERSDKSGDPGARAGVWDPAKYISIDEIQPGMEAYCCTCYNGTEIEKFDLDVLSVVRNVMPGRDWVLVKCTDERFIHTGPVAGCSGSPVYVEGRLAGAIAYVPGGAFSKDPIFGVTPIEEMLKVGQGSYSEQGTGLQDSGGFVFDFSKPIDFSEIDRQITAPRLSRNNSLIGVTTLGSQAQNNAFFCPLPCPLITSGLPRGVCEQLGALVEPCGLVAVPGIGGDGERKVKDVQLVPGACLAVPLVTGDIEMAVLGTATEVVGDKIYGFGHSFLGYGPVDLPMATAQVHAVVSSLYSSFKLASVLEVVGALTTDESAAVFGQIGAKAGMIPLTIRVDRYNDAERRAYNCQVANNRLYTPLTLRAAVSGAALYLGDFPPDHMIEYDVTIDIEDGEQISFENVSTGLGAAEMIVESVGSVVMLMNNPYKKVDIKSIDFDIRIMSKNIISHIWSVDLSDSKVKAGENIEIGVVVESVRAGKKKYQCGLDIPEDLAPGKYELNVCGWRDYAAFLRKTVPYKFIAQSMPGLIEALNYSLQIDRDKLYFLLVLPPGGVAVEQAELPDLPATKALVLQNAKRVLKTQPYPHWLENSLETGTVVIDKKVMRIMVEK